MFFVFVFAPFTNAVPALAANTYTRTPADATATNPLSFHYDYTDWDNDVLPDFNGSAVNFRYFLLHVTDGVHEYNSDVLPCADTIGFDFYCPGTDATPKSIDFTATLAADTAPYTVRLCGSNASATDASGYFTSSNSCITYGWFQTAPMNMLADSFTVVAPDVMPPSPPVPPLPPLASPSAHANPPSSTVASKIFSGQFYPGNSMHALNAKIESMKPTNR